MCGSAAATLTQPLGSTSSVAGGLVEARRAAHLRSRTDRSRAPSRRRTGARARSSTCAEVADIARRVGSSLSHSRAAVPMRISLPVLKRKAPSARARSMTRLGLVDIEPGRRERDLERQPGRAHRAARRVRLGERRRPAAGARRLLGVAVEADLHRADRQPREALGDRRVEALAVGLDLELHPGAPERFGELEEMRHDQRLAAAQHHVGHVVARRSRPRRACASSASSSSGRRLPGADSVQQCRQQRSQSRVSCHDTNSGAPS